jgi:RHS repeat-associated protein
MSFDPATGLYNDEARWYSTAVSTFISRDPMGLAAGMNLYRYCDNRPTDATDPSGLVPVLLERLWEVAHTAIVLKEYVDLFGGSESTEKESLGDVGTGAEGIEIGGDNLTVTKAGIDKVAKTQLIATGTQPGLMSGVVLPTQVTFDFVVTIKVNGKDVKTIDVAKLMSLAQVRKMIDDDPNDEIHIKAKTVFAYCRIKENGKLALQLEFPDGKKKSIPGSDFRITADSAVWVIPGAFIDSGNLAKPEQVLIQPKDNTGWLLVKSVKDVYIDHPTIRQ